MRFSEVPIELQVHIEELVRDKQFQQRFATDDVLNQLDQLKFDPFVQYNQVQLALHNKLKFYDVQFQPMTIGLWAYLYTIKSPLVVKQKKVTNIDADLFFYLLQTKDFGNPLQILLMKSLNYSSEVLKLKVLVKTSTDLALK